MLETLTNSIGLIPKRTELTQEQQCELAGFVIASHGIDAEYAITQALIESQLLGTMIATRAIDRVSKYQMIEDAVMKALEGICDTEIEEFNNDIMGEELI